jgi:NADH dehydrogenase [ubiquinone] 1 alpha subcomplex assembly factor 7
MTAGADETPLARLLIERIRREGPISVRDYMDACLNHPEHGYYRRRIAIGSEGDFITAPEISQVFGELIGLWAAVVWQQMGAPSRVCLVELGPGRGTLMRDALRAARKVPGFRDALDVVLVEQNSTLAAVQRTALAEAGVAVRWADDLAVATEMARDAATIVIGNEFLDVIPVRQLEWTGTEWYERGVGLDDMGRLAFVNLARTEAPSSIPTDLQPGVIVEQRDTGSITAALGRLAQSGPVAALFIDYGYDNPAAGDTLQAMRAQRYEHPLASPGAADLTAHVDFTAFAADVRDVGLAIDGPRTQAEFLGALGIVERTSRLMSANPQLAPTLEAATARLMAPTGMGTLFKVIGARSPALTALPGL